MWNKSLSDSRTGVCNAILWESTSVPLKRYHSENMIMIIEMAIIVKLYLTQALDKTVINNLSTRDYVKVNLINWMDVSQMSPRNKRITKLKPNSPTLRPLVHFPVRSIYRNYISDFGTEHCFSLHKPELCYLVEKRWNVGTNRRQSDKIQNFLVVPDRIFPKNRLFLPTLLRRREDKYIYGKTNIYIDLNVIEKIEAKWTVRVPFKNLFILFGRCNSHEKFLFPTVFSYQKLTFCFLQCRSSETIPQSVSRWNLLFRCQFRLFNAIHQISWQMH